METLTIFRGKGDVRTIRGIIPKLDL